MNRLSIKWKQCLTLHVIRLPSRRFTCNVKHYFLWKIWKTCFENVVCQLWLALKRLRNKTCCILVGRFTNMVVHKGLPVTTNLIIWFRFHANNTDSACSSLIKRVQNIPNYIQTVHVVLYFLLLYKRFIFLKLTSRHKWRFCFSGTHTLPGI